LSTIPVAAVGVSKALSDGDGLQPLSRKEIKNVRNKGIGGVWKRIVLERNGTAGGDTVRVSLFTCSDLSLGAILPIKGVNIDINDIITHLCQN